jgi:uncharacterized protein (TIGR03067 family)
MQGRTLPVPLLVGLLTAVAAAVAADDPDATKRVAAEEEARRLEGTWEVVYYEWAGTAEPQQIGRKFVFTCGRMQVGDVRRWSYRVDPRREPARIDIEAEFPADREGNQQRGWFRDSFRGIYRCDGDRMVLCYWVRGPGGERERIEFRTAEDSPGWLMTLRRVQPKAK